MGSFEALVVKGSVTLLSGGGGVTLCGLVV